MNEQQAYDMLDKILANAPQVGSDLITIAIAGGIVAICILLLLSALIVKAGIMMLATMDSDEKEGRVFMMFLGAVALSLPISVIATLDIWKAWLFPKVYLMEYALGAFK